MRDLRLDFLSGLLHDRVYDHVPKLGFSAKAMHHVCNNAVNVS